MRVLCPGQNGTSTARQLRVRRIWLPLLIFVLSVSGVAVAADAFVVTDREQLDGFVELVTRGETEARIDGALGYFSPAELPVRLQQGHDAQEYGSGDQQALADALRGALGVFDSSEQSLLQHAVRVDGDRATVTTRMGDPSYEQTVIYELVREGERWLVRRVRVL